MSATSENHAAEPVDISLLDLYRLLELFVMLLSEQAWRNMGLRVDPRTNDIKRNFEKTHVAIECIISIVDKLEPHINDATRNRLRSLITDLQINYARQLEQQ